jgi:hypothetical protein
MEATLVAPAARPMMNLLAATLPLNFSRSVPLSGSTIACALDDALPATLDTDRLTPLPLDGPVAEWSVKSAPDGTS